jgi:hypothetical protein
VRAELLLQDRQQESFWQIHSEYGMQLRIYIRLCTYWHKKRYEMLGWHLWVIAHDMLKPIGGFQGGHRPVLYKNGQLHKSPPIDPEFKEPLFKEPEESCRVSDS